MGVVDSVVASDALVYSDTGDWNDKVIQYLEKHLGDDYAQRFKNSSPMPYDDPTAAPTAKSRRQLIQGMRTRLDWLNQLAKDLDH